MNQVRLELKQKEELRQPVSVDMQVRRHPGSNGESLKDSLMSENLLTV